MDYSVLGLMLTNGTMRSKPVEGTSQNQYTDVLHGIIKESPPDSGEYSHFLQNISHVRVSSEARKSLTPAVI